MLLKSDSTSTRKTLQNSHNSVQRLVVNTLHQERRRSVTTKRMHITLRSWLMSSKKMKKIPRGYWSHAVRACSPMGASTIGRGQDEWEEVVAVLRWQEDPSRHFVRGVQGMGRRQVCRCVGVAQLAGRAGNAWTTQNAALEAQLRGHCTRSCRIAWSDRDSVESCTSTDPPVFSVREEDFYVWAKKVENDVSGVFPNVRGAVSFALESQDAVTATSVALGVLELEAEMSTENDGQLLKVLSALTDGESFDVVMLAGGDRGFESWRKLHRR